MESLKYEIREKTTLLQEAGLALEELETKISTITIEREEEKSRLEAKIRQIEDEEEIQLETFPDELEAASSDSGGHTSKDEDERLLREVDKEMARRVSLSLPLNTSHDLGEEMKSPGAVGLFAVPERQEAEVMAGKVEELEAKVEEISVLLEQSIRERDEVNLRSKLGQMFVCNKHVTSDFWDCYISSNYANL